MQGTSRSASRGTHDGGGEELPTIESLNLCRAGDSKPLSMTSLETEEELREGDAYARGE